MRVTNNELIVRRNETFTLDRLVVNQDGSPYIISSEMQNPYFIISVSNSLYDTENRYLVNFWLPVTTPRFKSTRPMDVATLKNANGEQMYLSWANLKNTFFANVYIDGKLIESVESDDAVWYFEDDNGDRDYRYWNGETWVPYECRIIFKFLQAFTKDWVERSYYYNIDLVDGIAANEVEVGGRPLIEISELIPILEPTKLSVLSNLKGGL